MSDTQVYAELYRERVLRRHRWRLRHVNGNILADSGQSYSRRADALAGLARVTGTRVVQSRTSGVISRALGVGTTLVGLTHDGTVRRIEVRAVAK